jgi:hypothetical protein
MCLRASNPKMRLSESNFGRTYITLGRPTRRALPTHYLEIGVADFRSQTCKPVILHADHDAHNGDCQIPREPC